MIDAYKIGVSMFLETNVSQALPGVIRAFEAINKIAKEAQTNTAALGTALRDMGRAEPGIRALAGSMERLNSAQQRAADLSAQSNSARPTVPNYPIPMPPVAPRVSAGGAGGGNGSGGGGVPAVIPNGPNSLVPNGIPLNPGFNQAPKAPSNGELMHASIGFGIVGAAITDFIKNAIEARAEVEHLQVKLRTMGFTPAETDQALAEAKRLQQQVPGTSIAGGLHLIEDIKLVLQKNSDALNPAVLTDLAKTAIVLQSAGKGDEQTNMLKAIQAGELRGALNGPDGELSVESLQKFLRNVEVTTVQTGGRVGPAEILQYLKSSNAGGAMLTDSALFADSIMPILSMGAAKAGTALQGFSMQFASGKMSQASAEMLRNMGLLDIAEPTFFPKADGKGFRKEDPLDAYKVGIGQYRIPQDRMQALNGAAQNPFETIEKIILPALDKYNTEHGGLAAGPEALMAQRMATVQALAARVPGSAVMGDVVRNYMLLLRDRAAIADGQNRNAYDERSENDPKVKFQALTAAVNAMMVSLGGPIMDSAIKGIQTMTAALNAVSNWAAAHPETAGDIMKVAGVMGLLSLAVAGASASVFFAGPMIKTLQWLAGAQAAAAAGNMTAVGAAIASVAGIVAAAAITLGVSAAINSGLNYVAHSAEDAIYGKDNPNLVAARAARQAVGNFSILDRTTWADPNGHWWNMSPKMPSASSGPTGPIPVIVTNGRDLANGVAGHIADRVSRASSGQTGFDPRMTPSPTGATP